MDPQAPTATSPSALYRRVWRWHFYAGLICMPFLLLLAITGGLYLFKEPIEAWLYADLRQVDGGVAQVMDAETLVAKARLAVPGEPVRFTAPSGVGRSAEVGIRTDHGLTVVFMDPATGRVLGQLREDTKFMEIVKRLHSLVIAGPVGNHWIEIVAGWAIVLVMSGLFLWWPRGRSRGVYSVRGNPGQRMWWRDLHAVTGATAAAAILFLAVTGMPWSPVWGKQVGRLAGEWGVGLPKYLFGPGPQSAIPHSALGDVPWVLTDAPLPSSGLHDGHGHDHAPALAGAESAAAVRGPSIGLNRALAIASRSDIPQGTPIALPVGPAGVYSAMLFADDVRATRVLHLDRYSGEVLAEVGYADYGAVGRMTQWGVSIHTGRQFGWINQLVMLAGCVSIVVLSATAAVMWWKRRPRGRLAAPPRKQGDRAARGAIAVAVVLGLVYPLLGASMLAALVIDVAVPRRWHDRFAL